MDKEVVYKDKQIEVKGNSDSDKKITVYAHPKDRIVLNIDISQLKKTLINGDLVIETLNGGTISIANYASMFMQSEEPEIVDGLGVSYDVYSLFGNKAEWSFNDVEKYVLSRTIASSDSQSNSGDYLASAKIIAEGKMDQLMLLGNIPIEQQSPIVSESASLKAYEMKTMHLPTKYKYDVLLDWTQTGSTVHSKNQAYTKDTPVIISNPIVTPLYGSSFSVEGSANQVPQDYILEVMNGGGFEGLFDSVKYLYTPYDIDMSALDGSLYFEGNNSTYMQRVMNVKLNGASIGIKSIIIRGIPESIAFIAGDTTDVQRLSKDTWVITPKTQQSSINVTMQYEEGMPDITSAVEFSILAYNFKTKKIIEGVTNVVLDFHSVAGAGDVLNFSTTNGYTYSTSMDVVAITATQYDDYFIGGRKNDIYILLTGDDIFTSGKGNEIVDMGEGADTFYAGYGADVVDGGGNSPLVGGDVVTFERADFKVNDVDIYLESGNIKVIGVDGKQSLFRNFEVLVLDGDNNEIFLQATFGFSLTIIGKGGDDTIKLLFGSVIDASNASIQAGGSGYVYFAPSSSTIGYENEEAIEYIIGSPQNDTFLGSANYSVSVDLAGGFDIIDYSGYVIIGSGNAGITYENNIVSKPGGQSNSDRVAGFEKFIGTVASDIIYADADQKYGIAYLGYYDATAIDNDKVSYLYSSYGVVIDYTTGSSLFINVNRVINGKTYTDELSYIESVEASNQDDTFLVNGLSNAPRYFDGLGGSMDTLNYSAERTKSLTFLITGWSFDILSYGATGRVEIQGTLNYDVFVHMEGFVGSESGDTFKIEAESSMLMLDGSSGVDTVDYSRISSGLNVNVGKDSMIVTRTSSGFHDEIISTERVILNDANNEFRLGDIGYLSRISYIDAGNQEGFIIDNMKTKGDVFVVENSKSSASLNVGSLANVVNNFESLSVETLKDFEVVFDSVNIPYSKLYGVAKPGAIISANFFGYVSSIDVIITNKLTKLTLGGFQTLYTDGITSFVLNSLANNVDINHTNTNYRLDGGDGYDSLSYENSIQGIIFDLYLGRSTDDRGSFEDTFVNFESFVGSSTRSNLFILHPSIAYQIRGGAAEDTVSFQYYDSPITNLATNNSNFESIENYILTNFSDSLFLYSLQEATFVDGLGGIEDSLKLTTAASGATAIDLRIIFGASMINILGGVFDLQAAGFERFIGDAINNDSFEIDNFDFENSYGSSRIHIEGGAGTATDVVIIKSKGDHGIAIGSRSSLDNEFYSKIFVQGDAVNSLYADGIEKFVFGDGDDTVYLTNDYSSIDTSIKEIDLGGGINRLSFANDPGTANVTLNEDGTIDLGNKSNLNIKSWSAIEFGNAGGNVSLNYNSSTSFSKYSFFGGAGSVLFTVNLNNINASNISLDLAQGNPSKLLVNFGSTANKFNIYNIYNYTFNGAENVDVILSAKNAYNIIVNNPTGEVSADYSLLRIGGVFSFNASNSTLNTAKGSNVDFLIGFNKLITSNETDNFVYTYDSKKVSDFTYIGGDIVGNDIIRLSGVASTDNISINIDKDNKITYTMVNGSHIYVENVLNITGTSGNDSFVISNLAYLSPNEDARVYYLNTNNNPVGKDTLTFSGFKLDSALQEGIYVDPNASKIYYSQGATVYNYNSYLLYRNLETIDFSTIDGINVLIVSSNSSTLKNVYGDGDDILSYINIRSAIVNQELGNITIPGANNVNTTLNGKNTFSNVTLTSLNDSIYTSDYTQSFIVDGGSGRDEISYRGNNANLTIDVKFLGSAVSLQVIKAVNVIDTINNIEVIRLSSGNVTVNYNLDNMILYSMDIYGSSGGTNVIDYSSTTQLDVSVTMNFFMNSKNYVEIGKYRGDILFGKDSFHDFNVFKGTMNNDIYNVVIQSSFVNNINIYTVGGSDSINLSTDTSKESNVVFANNIITVADERNTPLYTMNVTGNINAIYGLASKNDTFIFNNGITKEFNGVMINGNTNQSGTSSFNKIDLGSETNDLSVDFVAYRVQYTSDVNTYMDFRNIQGFTTGRGNDEFINLSLLSSYTLSGGDGIDTVSYDAIVTGITVTIDTNAIVVNKGGLSDNLSSVEVYRGSNASDLFIVNDFSLFKAGLSIDGNGGIDEVSFSNDKLSLSWIQDGSVLDGSGNKLSISNIENWSFSGSETSLNFTMFNTTRSTNFKSTSLASSKDSFVLNFDNVTNGLLVFNGTSISIYNLNTASSITLDNFEDFIIGTAVSSVVSAVVSNIDINISSRVIDLNGSINTVDISNITGVSSINLSDNGLSLKSSGGKSLDLLNVYNFNYISNTAVKLDTTIDLTIDGEYNMYFNSNVTNTIKITGDALINGADLQTLSFDRSTFTYKSSAGGFAISNSGAYSVNLNKSSGSTYDMQGKEIIFTNSAGALTSFSQNLYTNMALNLKGVSHRAIERSTTDGINIAGDNIKFTHIFNVNGTKTNFHTQFTLNSKSTIFEFNSSSSQGLPNDYQSFFLNPSLSTNLLFAENFEIISSGSYLFEAGNTSEDAVYFTLGNRASASYVFATDTSSSSVGGTMINNVGSTFKNFEILNFTTMKDNQIGTNHNSMAGNNVSDGNMLQTAFNGVIFDDTGGLGSYHTIIFDKSLSGGNLVSSNLDNRYRTTNETNFVMSFNKSMNFNDVNLSGSVIENGDQKLLSLQHVRVIETGSETNIITFSYVSSEDLRKLANNIHHGNKMDDMVNGQTAFTSSMIAFIDSDAGVTNPDKVDMSLWSDIENHPINLSTWEFTQQGYTDLSIDYKLAFHTNGFLYLGINTDNNNQVTTNILAAPVQTVIGMYNIEQIYLPSGKTMLQNVNQISRDVSIYGKQSLSKEDHLIVDLRNATINEFLTTDPSGKNQSMTMATYSSGAKLTVYNATVFFTNISQTVNLSIGSGNNYVHSNKITIYLDTSNDSNNEDWFEGAVGTDTTDDVISFANITSGSFYFSFMAWKNVGSAQNASGGLSALDANKFLSLTTETGWAYNGTQSLDSNPQHLLSGPNSTGTGGDASDAWANFIYSGQGNILSRNFFHLGVTFSNLVSGDNKRALVTNEGSALDTLYKISGAEKIIGTSASDTFSFGTFYYYDNGTSIEMASPVLGLIDSLGAGYGSASQGKLKEIDLGDGYDTYLFDSDTIDNPAWQGEKRSGSAEFRDRMWTVDFDSNLNSTIYMSNPTSNSSSWNNALSKILGQNSGIKVTGFEEFIIDDYGVTYNQINNTPTRGIIDDVTFYLPSSTASGKFLISFGGGSGQDRSVGGNTNPNDPGNNQWLQLNMSKYTGTSRMDIYMRGAGTFSGKEYSMMMELTNATQVFTFVGLETMEVASAKSGFEVNVWAPINVNFDLLEGKTLGIRGSFSNSDSEFIYYSNTADYTVTTSGKMLTYTSKTTNQKFYINAAAVDHLTNATSYSGDLENNRFSEQKTFTTYEDWRAYQDEKDEFLELEAERTESTSINKNDDFNVLLMGNQYNVEDVNYEDLADLYNQLHTTFEHKDSIDMAEESLANFIQSSGLSTDMLMGILKDVYLGGSNLTQDQIELLKDNMEVINDSLQDYYNNHNQEDPKKHMTQEEWLAYQQSQKEDQAQQGVVDNQNDIHDDSLSNFYESFSDENVLSSSQSNALDYLASFKESEFDLDLNNLYEHVAEQNDSNDKLDSDISSVLNMVSVDSVQNTFNLDETESMSFALDSDMSISDDSTIINHTNDHTKKHNNGFGN